MSIIHGDEAERWEKIGSPWEAGGGPWSYHSGSIDGGTPGIISAFLGMFEEGKVHEGTANEIY
jgi:hypothetical protein